MNKIETMLKIDLHCHLDGSLSLETVQELLGREVRAEELQVTGECKSLAEYLQKFELPLQCLQTAKGLETAAFRLIEEVAKENVKYIEVRFAPMLSAHKELSGTQVVQAVLKGLEAGRLKFGVRSNTILCAMRHHSEEQNLKMLKIARELLGQGVCAVDLAGDEAAYPMKKFAALFEQARKWELPFTIHAGECGSVLNVTDAVAYGARRIGHGIALKNYLEPQRICREKGMGIEMCPVSNLQTKAIQRIEDYPLEQFIQNGLNVTINTDNRTVSNTSLMKEIETVKRYWNQTDEEIVKRMRCAVEVAFLADQDKQELLNYF